MTGIILGAGAIMPAKKAGIVGQQAAASLAWGWLLIADSSLPACWYKYCTAVLGLGYFKHLLGWPGAAIAGMDQHSFQQDSKQVRPPQAHLGSAAVPAVMAP